ncbi:FkbM family methyltransferase [Paracrocinitomix mangrovi]|uniref:FkbM family methyltransferase n=1 Tax=Paracrocinitomix mangrovi TaxID=2862509 RepID=UPI001C8E7CEE|nr:FkbM family methyltransferase [Paracrocinitomix mangrovi]UKN01235.1 FkbM family methyltransferase [Paracrocinitomix mangrovi]
MRTAGVKSNLKIRRGPMKGVKWSTMVPDSRYLLGIYESDLTEKIISAVTDGKRLVDIGANAGYFSLVASKYGHKELSHIAAEPFPANVQLIQEHLKINNISNVVIEASAIADKNGEVEFSNTDNLAANTYKSESSIHKENLIKLNAIDLNTLSEKYDLKDNCFMKIDVEGAEFDVLQGGKAYLEKFHPEIVLATHDCHVKGVKEKCLNFLMDLGYSCQPIIDEKPIPGQEDFLCSFAN